MPTPRTPSQAERRQSLLELQAADLRVATIAYRLAAASEAICPITTPLTGMVLHDTAQYATELRDEARTAFGIPEGIALLAVAEGSPAAAAGLRAGDGVLAIAGKPLAPFPGTKQSSYAGVESATLRLDSLARMGSFTLTIRRGSRTLPVTVTPARGCVSRVQLVPSSSIEARADGTFVSVTTALLGYVKDDDELALVIAHEMAHNALGHRAQLAVQGVRRGLFKSFGSKAGKVLGTERAADRLAYYLMARSSFDPGVAPAFWKRLYEGPAGGFKDPKTHPSGHARIGEAMEIVMEIQRQRAAGKPLTP